jgi:hypothetical protein
VTRDSLRHLEGQVVHFSGRLSTWREQHDGDLAACLSHVQVRPWDGDAAISSCPVTAVVDHVWIHGIPTSQPRERLLSYEAIGRVAWYRRADGSVDLGIEKLPAICVDDFLVSLRGAALHPSRDHITVQNIQGLLDVVNSGKGQVYSWTAARSTLLPLLERFQGYLAASRAASAAAMAAAPQNGPCRGLDAGLPWGKKRRRPTAVTT